MRSLTFATTTAAICAAALGGCSYNWYEVIPGGLAVTPHRGSTTVTIETYNQRFKLHHEAASFWSPGGVSMLGAEMVTVGQQDLDVRTCRSSVRWTAPSDAKADGNDIPLAERGLMGPVRFYAGADTTSLMAVNVVTAQTWTAAVGLAPILSVIAVPAARRVLVNTTSQKMFVYDVDKNQVLTCGSR